MRRPADLDRWRLDRLPARRAAKADAVTGGDIRYLLRLGLDLEEVARRAGRTPLAIQKELEKDDQNDD
jgi:hypothetical protein